jgi:hypothetical protein
VRPAGEVRAALVKAMRDAKGPATTRLLAARACVGLEAARHTLDNLVRAGVADKPGTTRVPGVRRPVPVYTLRVPMQLPLPGVSQAGSAA